MIFSALCMAFGPAPKSVVDTESLVKYMIDEDDTDDEIETATGLQ